MIITRSKKGALRLYLAIGLLVLVNIGIIGGCIIIKRYRFDSFTEKELTVYVGNHFDLDSILTQIDDKVPSASVKRLIRLSRTKGFPPYIYTGAYRITDDMNVVEVYELLTSGNASPIRITFHNLRTKDRLTQEFVAETFGRTYIANTAATLTNVSDTAHPGHFTAGASRQITASREEIIPCDVLGKLPNCEFFASLAGGRLIKGRTPILIPDEDLLCE